MYDGHLGSYYGEVEDRLYDFIYIDGPTDRKIWNDLSCQKSFNSDILEIKKAKNFTAILDQRVWTLQKLRPLMKDYRLSYNVIKKVTVITNYLERD